MKRLLLITIGCTLCFGFAAQAQDNTSRAETDARSAVRPQSAVSAGNRTAEGDRLPTFQNISPKESVKRFGEWFRDAYLREFRLYKKQHKATYKYEEGDFQDVIVQFVVDTTGRAVLHSTRPAHLSQVQTEVLLTTFEKAPLWTPAVQKGRKVKVKFTMPVREYGR